MRPAATLMTLAGMQPTSPGFPLSAVLMASRDAAAIPTLSFSCIAVPCLRFVDAKPPGLA